MSSGRTKQQFSSSNSIDGSLSRLELGHSNCATASSLPHELSAATDDVDWGDLKQINCILLPKLFCPTVRKNCSSDWEKVLKFEAEGREFANFLKSLEQFIQAVKGQNNFW